MEHINWLIGFMQDGLNHYPAVTVIVGTFLLGENVALAVFALSAQGYIDPVSAIIFVFIGSMSADIFWFFMTEFVIRKYYEEHFTKKATKGEHKQFLIKLIDKYFFWVLILIKFLIGMRLILTIYIVLKNRIPFWRKVMLDAVGTVLLFTVLFPVGWFFGKGVSSVLSIQRGATGIISIIVFVFIFSILIPPLIITILKRFFKEDAYFLK